MNPSRIMTVEDEALVAMEIEERLEAMGYEVIGCAASGVQALALAEEQHPDLALMDIRLQGEMDGIAVAERIRQRFRIPVIFLTAYSEDETLQRAKLAEPFGYILKPFNDRELKSTIEIALYKHRAEEEIRRLTRLYDVLSQVNQTVVRVQSREELLPTVCRLAVERGEIDLAWVGWLDPELSRISPVAHFGNPCEMLGETEFHADERARPEGNGNPGKALREGKPFICNDCGAGAGSGGCLYPSSNAPRRLGFQSCGSFPLRFQGEVRGNLNVSVAERGFFRERESRLFEEVALDISFALDKFESGFQRKRTEAALRESEEQFRSMFELASVGMAQADPSTGRLKRVNDRLCAITGYKAEELLGMRFTDITHPEDRQRDWEAFQKVVRGEMPEYHGEKRYVRKDGKIAWVNVNVSVPRDGDGRPMRSLAVIEDITERKHLQVEQARMESQLRQAQKMEALGTLAGGIAHDFNNILGIILGYTEMACYEATEGSALLGQLQQVLKAADRAKELVRQILAFSRVSEQEKKPVQVGLIVREAMKMLRASLPSTIEIKADAASKAVVMADPSQIHQVLMNLCTNAAHAMRAGVGVLDVSLTDVHLASEAIPPHWGLQPGPHVKVSVRDTGHGIDPSILDRIFDPFFTTKEQGVGTGLGLAVVHGIVKGLGGAIEVESLLGKGTTFHVFLPSGESVAAGEVVEAALLPRGSERILLVDDEPALAMAAKEMLERLGYEVDYRSNGIEALEIFRARLEEAPFDLVITDMTMPRLTGADLAGELHKMQPGLPVILCTGFSEKLNEERARSLGIQALIMKPFAWRQLAELVRKVLCACPRK